MSFSSDKEAGLNQPKVQVQLCICKIFLCFGLRIQASESKTEIVEGFVCLFMNVPLGKTK